MQFWACGAKYEEKTMSTMLDDSPEVKEAYDAYRKFTANPVIRKKIMTEERDRNMMRIQLASAKKEGKIETARNMKAKGLAVSLIVEVTGLTEAEIENLG
jgi:predicted transposase/invertase (TIGR01784 family)